MSPRLEKLLKALEIGRMTCLQLEQATGVKAAVIPELLRQYQKQQPGRVYIAEWLDRDGPCRKPMVWALGNHPDCPPPSKQHLHAEYLRRRRKIPDDLPPPSFIMPTKPATWLDMLTTESRP